VPFAFYLLNMIEKRPFGPVITSLMNDRMKIHTIAEMSTPNAGGTTFRVAARIGSVGRAMRFHGSLFRLIAGYLRHPGCVRA